MRDDLLAARDRLDGHVRASDRAAVPEEIGRFQPLESGRRDALRRMLDPYFADTVQLYLAGLLGRDGLDTRTRLLVLVGQFTMKRLHDRLAETVCAAVQEEIDQREVLEVVLQCFVYGGETILDGALAAVLDGLHAAGADLDERALQPGQRDRERDLEHERAAWHKDDREDPRLQPYLEKYGWERISTGLRLRPKHILDVVEYLDSVDEDFARLWLDATYHDMYSRNVLDDKTRLLCMVGDLVCIGETVQSRHHMRGALRQGAQPRELLEIVFQTCGVFGHEYMVPACVHDVVTIVHEECGVDLTEGPDRAHEAAADMAVRRDDGRLEHGSRERDEADGPGGPGPAIGRAR